MKLWHLLLLALPLAAYGYPGGAKRQQQTQAAEPAAPAAAAADKTISLDDVAVVDNEHAASGTQSSAIQKRSGSFDYVAHLKSGLLSSIGHASASIASGSSGGSSGGGGGGGGYKSHDSGHHGNSLDYDPWSFKKTVLNTIFQAVKAITGGVTALKGQLIKGGGYVLSASGNLVAASGDKVTNVGKNIIHSAQINTPSFGHSGGGGSYGSSGGGGGGSVHPFAKFSSLSGASSGGSSGGNKHSASPPGQVIHTETITTYEIPSGSGGDAHLSYGPPSKAPTYSSATHQYLPPAGSYSGGGAPFSHGGGGGSGGGGIGSHHHAAFEAPPSNYLPSSAYDNAYEQHDGHDDFNIYGRHQKLSDADAKKAAVQLQEILQMLPQGKTEFTASKTVTLDTSSASYGHRPGDINPNNVDVQTYGLPNDLGQLESLSHTASITATYAPPSAAAAAASDQSPSDIYRQMAKKQSPEEIYIQNHPDEQYDYQPAKQLTPPQATAHSDYKYTNYHVTNGAHNALNDLTPIIAALESTKRKSQQLQRQHGDHAVSTHTHYAIEKSVHRTPPASSQTGATDYRLPPIVQKSKHIYFDPAQNRPAATNQYPVYTAPPAPALSDGSNDGSSQYTSYAGPYKVRRHVPDGGSGGVKAPPSPSKKKASAVFRPQDYEISDPLMFNRMFSMF